MRKGKSLSIPNDPEKNRPINRSMRMTPKAINIQGRNDLTDSIDRGNDDIMCNRCKRKQICSGIQHTRHIPTH